jgi:hypothetical protein
MADLSAFASRQEKQLLALDDLQAQLDMLKRRAGGGSGNGTLISMVSDLFAAAIEAAFPQVHPCRGKERGPRMPHH